MKTKVIILSVMVLFLHLVSCNTAKKEKEVWDTDLSLSSIPPQDYDHTIAEGREVESPESEETSVRFTPPVITQDKNVSRSSVTQEELTASYDMSTAGIDIADLSDNKIIVESHDESSISLSFNEAPANKYYASEEPAPFVENRFISPFDEPLSTFSIDVDNASYTHFRRHINNGYKPLPDAVRIEEFINYFSYSYDQPTEKDPVKITAETGECPWNKEHRLVRIGIKAKEIDQDQLPPSNFVFLIDVSGSMEGPDRLGLVKSSLNLLVNNMRREDRIAIVVYAGRAGLVLPSTSGKEKQKIKEALNRLSAGGSTAGGAGIQLAYEIALENFKKRGNNRIILCTDGDFNVGVSSEKGLEQLIEEKRKSGVFLSILGYGMGNYKDRKMQVLAEKGNGNAYYIDNLQEANKVLVTESSGTLYTIAKDVKLQLEFNPARVQAYRLVGYESRMLNKEDFNDDTKDAGEMGAGHAVTALYEVVPVGVKSDYVPNVDKLKYQSVRNDAAVFFNTPELLTVKLRYKQPNGDKSVKIEHPLIDSERNSTSADMRFASAVAMFAQLLRDSKYKGDATYAQVINLAKSAYGQDTDGYRREFVRLAETVQNLN